MYQKPLIDSMNIPIVYMSLSVALDISSPNQTKPYMLSGWYEKTTVFDIGHHFYSKNHMHGSYSPRTRACCSQSGLTILKIRESSPRALFLYNCIPNTLRARERSVA